MAHKSLDASVTQLRGKGEAGIAHEGSLAAHTIAVDPLDVIDELSIVGGPPALRTSAPGIIASWRDTQHVAQDRHRIVGAAIRKEEEILDLRIDPDPRI